MDEFDRLKAQKDQLVKGRTRLVYRMTPELFFGKTIPIGPKTMAGTCRYLAGSADPEDLREALRDAVLEHIHIEPERRVVKVYISCPIVRGAETHEGDHAIELHQEWLR